MCSMHTPISVTQNCDLLRVLCTAALYIFFAGTVPVLHCCLKAELYGMKPHDCNCSANKAVSACVAVQHWCGQHTQGFEHCSCAIVLVESRAVQSAKPHECNCRANKAVSARVAMQHRGNQHTKGFEHCSCAMVLVKSRAVCRAKALRCNCNH